MKFPSPYRVHDGISQASLTSVTPSREAASQDLLDQVLTALDWDSSELDLSIVPAKAYAGAWHLIIAAGTKAQA